MWNEEQECRVAEEVAGAVPIMALFKRWRAMENPWAKGGDVGARQLCRGMSVKQAERGARRSHSAGGCFCSYEPSLAGLEASKLKLQAGLHVELQV